ncbi:MAG: ATP-binding protein [Oscillospiraceae bacterium]|nr:ATP-binding protein [Oscillospiraceae bacterium]
MAKVILICGKICSGKSYYAKGLQADTKAVILSTDEATYDLINNEQGDFYNIFAARVNRYLRKKAVEIINAGADVILDWGFWTESNRREISQFFKTNNVEYEWHYIDVDDKTWYSNIRTRNERITEGCGGSDFYVDDGLMKKLLSLFEVPHKDEIDVWYKLNMTSNDQ